jgi:hypothetical protein
VAGESIAVCGGRNCIGAVGDITETVSEPALATYTLPVLGLTAIPRGKTGKPPTGMVAIT